ncbi:MAG TPA: hypothetical protein VNC50_18120, partial [Planctomycetia bacterium]|nr:hypothetical protein [Planctomycetia bacterium]
APDPPDCVHLRGEQDHLVEEDDHHELSRFAGTDEITLAGIGHRDFQLTPGRWFIFWENPRHRERLDQTDDTGASRRDRIVRMLRAVFTRVPEDARRDPANKSIAPPEEKLELSALDDRAARRVAMARVLESSRDRRAGARPEIVAAESRAIGKTAEGAIAHGPVSPAPGTVVFLIHGIRDYADWHRTLEHEIKQRVPLRPPVVHSVKYGYFSALQFLLPHERHRAARAFLDLYAQERAARPRDRFLVVAHSNGTFVLAKTLAVPRVRIDRIYLAGSVMGRRTLWPAGALVRNACAPADEPVGAICWVLSLLPRYGYGTTLPLGVGGVAGFAGDAVQNFGLRSGGHGAGLVAAEHPAIASFLLDDPPPPPPEARPKPSRLYLVSIRLLLIVILSLAVGAGWWSYSLAPAATLQSLAGALVALLVVRILIWF